MAYYETVILQVSVAHSLFINGRAMPRTKGTESLPSVLFTSFGWKENGLCYGQSGS